MVDHQEIFDDPSKLPVFNSNAIISQPHRIPGLSEHFLYINDDVFFGRPVAKNLSSPAVASPGSFRRRAFAPWVTPRSIANRPST